MLSIKVTLHYTAVPRQTVLHYIYSVHGIMCRKKKEKIPQMTKRKVLHTGLDIITILDTGVIKVKVR